jgi:hypothetical protein
MIKYFILAVVLLVLMSCSSSSTDLLDFKKTWVYVELKVVTDDTDYYYYFGQINQKILDKLAADKSSGSFFVLSNVRYYNDFDNVQEYADATEEGTLFFRTDDIVKLEVLKHDPLNNKISKDTIVINK